MLNGLRTRPRTATMSKYSFVVDVVCYVCDNDTHSSLAQADSRLKWAMRWQPQQRQIQQYKQNSRETAAHHRGFFVCLFVCLFFKQGESVNSTSHNNYDVRKFSEDFLRRLNFFFLSFFLSLLLIVLVFLLLLLLLLLLLFLFLMLLAHHRVNNIRFAIL